MNDQPARKKIRYEYRIKSTPEYTSDIEEQWEVYNVFHSYLSNKEHNFIIVFRREL